MSKENKLCIVLSFMLILYMSFIICIHEPWNIVSDGAFLFNRASQILNCIEDGVYPFFYYNDYCGVGYGSSFFYGQLTLLPFSLLIKFGEQEFFMAYTMATIIINFFGISTLAKRFVKDNYVVGFLYTSSFLFVMLMWYSQMYSCYMAIGIGFFFLAFCVDFFRDGKSCIKASLMYCILFNTHMLTSVICFLLCVCFFIRYFNKKDIKRYISFALLTFVLISYNLCNILYHSNSINNLSKINYGFNFISDESTKFGFALGRLPIGSSALAYLLVQFGIAYPFSSLKLVNIPLAVLLICGLIKSFKMKYYNIYVPLILLGIVIGVGDVWQFLYDAYQNVFQFPIRYLPFLLAFALILVFKGKFIKFVKITCIFCMIDVIALGLFKVDSSSFNTSKTGFYYVGNGEYLSDNFIYDQDVFHKYYNSVIGENDTYEFSKDKNKLIIDLTDCKDTKVTIPKLFYNGYYAKDITNNVEVECREGYSMFTELELGEDFSGVVEVYYKQPLPLVLLLVFVYLFGTALIIYQIYHGVKCKIKS